MQTGLIYEDNRVSHDKSSVEEDISCCVTMTSWKFTPHTSMVCTANISNVKKVFAVSCFTLYFCCTLGIWLLSQGLEGTLSSFYNIFSACIEMINNKARHNLMDANCKWRSDWLGGSVSFREPLGQTKVMQIRQGEMLNHQGAIALEVCCLAAQMSKRCTCAAHGTTSKCQEYSGKII